MKPKVGKRSKTLRIQKFKKMLKEYKQKKLNCIYTPPRILAHSGLSLSFLRLFLFDQTPSFRTLSGASQISQTLTLKFLFFCFVAFLSDRSLCHVTWSLITDSDLAKKGKVPACRLLIAINVISKYVSVIIWIYLF